MNNVIVTRDGELLYDEMSLIDWLNAHGIDTRDVDTVGQWLNEAENVAIAKAEIASDLLAYETELEQCRAIADGLTCLISEKLRQNRLTGMREFLRYISAQLHMI